MRGENVSLDTERKQHNHKKGKIDYVQRECLQKTLVEQRFALENP